MTDILVPRTNIQRVTHFTLLLGLLLRRLDLALRRRLGRIKRCVVASDFAIRACLGGLRSLRVEDSSVAGFLFSLLLMRCLERRDGAEGAACWEWTGER